MSADISPDAGRTTMLGGRAVGRMGYGAMQLGERGGLAGPDREVALGVLRRAVELGVNHIDTAQFYGGGVVNDLISAALHSYSDDLAIVSKVGAEFVAGRGLVPAQRPEQLRAGVESNLRALGVERLAAVNMRRMDTGGALATGDQVVPLDDQLAVLVQLRDEGKIEGIGVSNVSLEQLQAALPVGLVCVQNAYSLLDRSDEALLDLCRENDVAWVPFFPLGSGFEHLPKVTDDPAVIATATRLGATPAQVGLAWLLAHDDHVLLIPGTSSVTHLEENMAAGTLELDVQAMADLDA